MSVPAFKDLTKQSNTILSKDFYHLAPLSLEARTVAPNGVSFAVDGMSSQKNNTLAGKLETRYADKKTGVALTQGWLTSNVLSTKVEVANAFTKGLNGSIDTTFMPATNEKTAKLNLNYSHPGAAVNVVADVVKRSFTGNAVFGKNGFVAGAEAGYDLKRSALTRQSFQLGFLAPTYAAAISATDKFSLYTVSIYNQVNLATELSARTVWQVNSPTGSTVALEAAVKHKLDPSSFVKAKLNNLGVACFSYSQALRPGVTLGVGLEANITKMNEASHKVGLSLKFAA